MQKLLINKRISSGKWEKVNIKGITHLMVLLHKASKRHDGFYVPGRTQWPQWIQNFVLSKTQPNCNPWLCYLPLFVKRKTIVLNVFNHVWHWSMEILSWFDWAMKYCGTWYYLELIECTTKIHNTNGIINPQKSPGNNWLVPLLIDWHPFFVNGTAQKNLQWIIVF